LSESNFHILMVDDITRYQKLYEFAIKDAMDADVSFATNGIEALEKLEDAEQFSLLILDLNMPKLGGEETLRRIRKNPNLDNLPVIILTGDSDDETQKRLLELGADDFIEKGAPPELFVSRLKAQMRYKETIDRLTSMAMDMDIFAAGVLHDIRNLETNIVSICYIARTLLDEDPVKNKEAICSEVESLKEQATRIGTYAHDIIQMVRETQTQTTIESQDISEIIRWVREILGSGQVVAWNEPKSYISVAGDLKFLKLAIFNLIQNSIKYAKEDETPAIEITQTRTQGGLTGESENVITRFRDFGIGIEADDLRNVFKPFIKGKNNQVGNNKATGFGLGLSLVVKVVSAMKGKVWAEIPPSGEGTVVCIELPIAADHEAAQ